MKRGKGRRLPRFGMTLPLLKLVVLRSHSAIGVKGCLLFLAQVLP
jgi:hypothetical protein